MQIALRLLAVTLLSLCPSFGSEEVSLKESPVKLGTFQTLSGRVYLDSVALKVSLERVSLRHKGGMAIVPIADLPEATKDLLPLSSIRIPPRPMSEEERKILLDSSRKLIITRASEKNKECVLNVSLSHELDTAVVWLSSPLGNKRQLVVVPVNELVSFQGTLQKFLQWREQATRENMPAVDRAISKFSFGEARFAHSHGTSLLVIQRCVFNAADVEGFLDLLGNQFESASDEFEEKLASLSKALTLR